MPGRPRSPVGTPECLRQVVEDGDPQLLGLLIERRWQIVSARQKTLVRIHEQLVKLVPGGVPRGLSADKTARLLRSIRPTDPVAKMRRRIVKELLAELRVLDRKPVSRRPQWTGPSGSATSAHRQRDPRT